MQARFQHILLIAFLLPSIKTIFAQEVPVFEWAKAMGATDYDAGHSIATDGAGNVLTTGSFQGTVDFDPGLGTFDLILAVFDDIFISKLDASGNFVWAIQFGGANDDYANSITTDATGNVFTTGPEQK